MLENIDNPNGLKKLSRQELTDLALEIRDKIIRTVSENGGHLASNLGIVELTMALSIVFEFPRDKIVFDVGHQAYTWKLLTGRREQFASLRCLDGLSGFPKTGESVYDSFNTGHSSTSISAALGLSQALSQKDRTGHVIAVIGDGALTGGMAFEALNNAAQTQSDLIVVLNDNQMSIGQNVGGLSRHLEHLRLSKPYLKLRSRYEKVISAIPLLGKPILMMTERLKFLAKFAVKRQGIFFEQLGFRYYGPVDGHNLPELTHQLRAIGNLRGPILFHVITQKGRGYAYAEDAPDVYHGVAPFVIEKGVNNGTAKANASKINSFTAAFGRYLCSVAKQDSNILAVSAAMTSGTGLSDFQALFPARFFDVGIAEQHAVTFAAGLAAGGTRPVIAIYSTFLQRAYDQLLHDICLQSLPVLIAIDRAGIVGEDGETHQGLFDLNLLLPLPNLEIFAPGDYASLYAVIDYALTADHPVAVRYPRASQWQTTYPELAVKYRLNQSGDVLKAEIIRQGSDVTLVALGPILGAALAAADLCAPEGVELEVIAVNCVKPLDLATILESVKRTGRVVFVEEGVKSGGFGQNCLASLSQHIDGFAVRLLGVNNGLLCQGKRDELLLLSGLDPKSIAAAALDLYRQENNNRL